MLTIAPLKGCLEEQTLYLFKEADLEVKRTDRDYNPALLMSGSARSRFYSRRKFPPT
ncbi:MAG: hypothetical protein WCF90_06675 [Methanomicrobiales archaeon]